jgi:HrpA-like RNA helicase
LPPGDLIPENLRVSVKRLYERAIQASEKSLMPYAEKLRLEFPAELPVSTHADELIDLIRKNQVLIVAGATGSGKTTQLPKMALAAGCGRYGRIGCTQPRRLAASSLARRAAAEMQSEFGSEVGYKVRFDDHTSENTVVKFMTDGILLAETRDDPDLLQYDCIMLDEVHERSLNIDFLMGYLKKLLQRRKNLKLIISSATLEGRPGFPVSENFQRKCRTFSRNFAGYRVTPITEDRMERLRRCRITTWMPRKPCPRTRRFWMRSWKPMTG